MSNILLEKKGLIRRFWSKVDVKNVDKCWYWKAARQSKGHGSFGIEAGKTELARRVA